MKIVNSRYRTVALSLCFVLSIIGYVFLGYFVPRTDHVPLFGIFGLLILLGIFMYRNLETGQWKLIFGIGIAFRIVLLFATPALSDDFYRFTWDGELSRDGYAAFAFTPLEYEDHLAPELHDKYEELLQARSVSFPKGMNSKGYYSIYPAINQWLFYTATFGGDPNGANLIILHIWLLIAEVVSFFLLRWLLKTRFKADWVAIYWWHPLIILELVGNLHLEGVAITFILAALYYARKNNWFGTGLMTAFAIMTKITPILILGALFRQFSWKNWILAGITAVVFSMLMFRLIVDPQTLMNFRESADLFFNLFVFNSASYYGLHELAVAYNWENAKETVAKTLPLITLFLGAYVVLFQKRSIAWTLMLLFTIHFFFSPIVHPWYITFLIPLAILTQTIYPLIWSLLIFGTYVSYGETYEIPYNWIYFEYSFVALILIVELMPWGNLVKRMATMIYIVPSPLDRETKTS